MMHNHETLSPEGQPVTPAAGAHCEQCGKDLSFAAYVIGASVLVGSILISVALLFMFFTVRSNMFRLGDQSGTVVAGQQGAPSAPSQPSAGQNAGAAAPSKPVNVALKSNTPYLGSGNAKVTVIEYADYQCPFCEKFYSQVFTDIKSKYIDTGKVKFMYQDFAFLGPDSNTASEAVHCAADQNKFWQYHDYLFTHQGAEGSGWATLDHQTQFAQALGLNMSQFSSCMSSGKYKQEVLDETAAGKSYGVTGTPTVFVNGTAIVGAQPTSAFEQAIETALSK